MRKINMVVISFVVICFVMTSFGQAIEYNESPMLRKLVEKGELPPVEQRISDKPKIVKLTEGIGNYGGTLHLVHSWVGQDPQLYTINAEYMFESYPFPAFNEKKMEPNILQDLQVSDNGKKFTFTLRKGLKWSDGVPVTTEDVRYYFEDVLGNKDLTAIYPSWLKRGGERAQFKVIDKYTYQLKFAKPYGLLSLRLQTHGGGHYSLFMLPSHYMKQFHKKYTSLEEMQPFLKEEGLEKDQWAQLHNSKNDASPWALDAEVGFPTLHPWWVVEKPSPGVTILERNPYYFKVDKDGNQLPYIDKIRMELIQDQEMKTMKIISGEVDFECGAGGLPLNKLPLYKENEDKGNYRTLLLDPTTIVTPVVYFPNLNNPEVGEILQNPKFRKALSLGIDREEINQLVFFGRGEPTQAASLPGSVFDEPEFRKAYTEYNPKKAHKLLDEIGLKDNDGDGWREGPDGKPLRIPVEFFEVNPNLKPTTELVVDYWQNLGIKADMKIIETSLWFERQRANQTVMSVWHQDGARPGWPFAWFVPFDENICYAPKWARWYNTNGQEGVEPFLEVKKQFNRYETILETTNEEERINIGKEIIRSQAENIWIIGTVGKVPSPIIINEKLKNIPGWSICTQWGLTLAEQIYFKN